MYAGDEAVSVRGDVQQIVCISLVTEPEHFDDFLRVFCVFGTIGCIPEPCTRDFIAHFCRYRAAFRRHTFGVPWKFTTVHVGIPEVVGVVADDQAAPL